jgi:DNA-binding NarL/FixJ family response regulator
MAENLSPREGEILNLVASGKTTKEIGAELSIADSTVNWHVSNVLEKLDASSRAEAVATALRGELLDAAEPSPAREPVKRERRPRLVLVAGRSC